MPDGQRIPDADFSPSFAQASAAAERQACEGSSSSVGLAEAEDVEIISQATLENRIIVTLDADFHRLLALAQARHPSIIRIRIQGLKAEEFSGLVQNVLSQCFDDLDAGSMISVSDLQVRVRRLPLS